MSRLVTRKVSRTHKKSAGAKRKFTSFKTARKTAKKNNGTRASANHKIYMTSIENFLNNIRTVAKKRASQKGHSDSIAKKLNISASNVRSQFKKSNILNPNTTKHLNDIGYSLRSVKNVSSNVKSQLPRVFRGLREGVRKDVLMFLGTLNRTVRSMTFAFTKWETLLRRNYASAKSGTKKYKIDPSITRQMKSFENNVSAFKSKWNKLLNSLSNHGNVQVQAGIRMIKKELETLQKSIRTNRVLIGSIVKSSKTKKNSKVRAQALITKSELKTHYNNWLKKQKLFQDVRNSIYHYVDQLKAIKSC